MINALVDKNFNIFDFVFHNIYLTARGFNYTFFLTNFLNVLKRKSGIAVKVNPQRVNLSSMIE